MGRVLITGAAKRLGRVLATRVAASGSQVVIHYNTSAEDAETTVRSIKQTGGDAVAVGGDLSNPRAVAQLVQCAADAAGGPLTALVNNASVFDYDDPENIDPEVQRTALDVNFAAPSRLAANFVAQAGPLSNPAIVNILDQKLSNQNPDFASYTASKSALAAWTTMLDIKVGDRVRVNALSPGILFPSFDQTDAEFTAVASQNLLKRPINPNDVATALVHILKARSLRGQVIHVDNGQRFVPSARDIMFSTRGAAPA